MLRANEDGRTRGPVPARTWTRTWLVASLVLAAAALLLGGTLGRWIAVALVLAAAPELIAPLRRLPQLARWGPRLRAWLPLALVIALAAGLLGDLALGRAPVSRDHGIHYFQTAVLVDELIPRGRLTGFSTRFNSGYPYGDAYPVLGYLVTGAASLVSGGWISLRTSYALGLLAIWTLAIAGVWWLAATVARELELGGPAPSKTADADRRPAVASGEPTAKDGEPSAPDREPQASDREPSAPDRELPQPTAARGLDPRWAGALAAVAWLVDPGSSREGGWNYLMFHGVWPQLLSSALWIASLTATWRAFSRPSPRRLGLAAGLLGASVLAHPFGMLTAALSAVAWPIVLWASGALRRLPPGAIRYWLIIHLAAALLCAGWLTSFLASAGSMARSPVPYETLGALALDLVSGELFRAHRAWVGPMAVVGLIVALRRGRAVAWLGIGLIAALLVLASQASITVVRLDLLVSAFKNLQFPRYVIALKPVLFAFSGVGAALVLGWIRQLPARDAQRSQRPLPGGRPAAARLLVCLCVAPLLTSAIDERDRLLPRPVGGVEVLEGSEHAGPEAKLHAALLEERAKSGDAMTVAFLRRGMGGGTYPLFAITDVGARLVLDGHVPAVNYRHQVRRRSPEALRTMGVTHVLHDRPLDDGDDARLAATLTPIGSFGPWQLARLSGEPALTLAHGSLRGAEISVERDGPERLRVQVSGESARGRLELALGPYRKWQARDASGEALELEATQLYGGVPGIEFRLAGPGTVELHYTRPAKERAAHWLSLAAALALALSLLGGRELELSERLLPPRAVQISWALGLATLAVILVGSGLRQRAQLQRTWEAVLEAHADSRALARGRSLAFRRDLIARNLWSVRRSTDDVCDGTLGRDAMAGCTPSDRRARLSMAYRAPYLYRCLRLELGPGERLEVEFELADDEDLAGFFVRDGSLDGLELRVAGAGEFKAVGPGSRHHLHLRADERGDAATLELRNQGRRRVALCLAAAAAGPD